MSEPPGEDGSPRLADALRAEGQRHLYEQENWQSIVWRERVEEAMRDAQAFTESLVLRSPVAQWFPGTRWTVAGLVTRREFDGAYLVWSPPDPNGWTDLATVYIRTPEGAAIQPADDPGSFTLVVTGRKYDTIRQGLVETPVSVTLVEWQIIRGSFADRHGWVPVVGSREELAIALAKQTG